MLSACEACLECGLNWIISTWSVCEQGAVAQSLVQVNDCFLLLYLPMAVANISWWEVYPKINRFWGSAIVQLKTPNLIPPAYHKGVGSLLETCVFPLPCFCFYNSGKAFCWGLKKCSVNHCRVEFHVFKLKYHIGTFITARANPNTCISVSCSHQCLWASPCTSLLW